MHIHFSQNLFNFHIFYVVWMAFLKSCENTGLFTKSRILLSRFFFINFRLIFRHQLKINLKSIEKP